MFKVATQMNLREPIFKEVLKATMMRTPQELRE
jgi:hypothetical protein